MNYVRPAGRNLAGFRGNGELCEQAHEGLGCAVVYVQTQDGPAIRLDQPPGALDQLLHHRLDPRPLGFMAHRRVGSKQATLPIRRRMFMATAASWHTM